MASTYSPSLRLELIGTGDQSGLWGDTTNNNLGDLIEQAITGVQSIPMTDTDYTLTALNGSVDEARNAVVIMTSIGSLTGSRNVFIPAEEKLYVFKNSTTGGQNLVVKTVGGAGYTVPNGQTALLYCDGTDCFQGITHLASPALTGIPTAPTAANGTNTTQIATTAFVQTAVASGVPSGCILMWSGSIGSIPSGWLLCNGSSGTPDLRNRFVVGAGSTYAVGATGGSANATLVSHTHTYSGTTTTAGSHSHSVYDPGHSHQYESAIGSSGTNMGGPLFRQTANTATAYTNISLYAAGDHAHTFSGSTSTEGASATNANLPPYYALCYIMKA